MKRFRNIAVIGLLSCLAFFTAVKLLQYLDLKAITELIYLLLNLVE